MSDDYFGHRDRILAQFNVTGSYETLSNSTSQADHFVAYLANDLAMSESNLSDAADKLIKAAEAAKTEIADGLGVSTRSDLGQAVNDFVTYRSLRNRGQQHLAGAATLLRRNQEAAAGGTTA
jgi:hypothetical protein